MSCWDEIRQMVKKARLWVKGYLRTKSTRKLRDIVTRQRHRQGHGVSGISLNIRTWVMELPGYAKIHYIDKILYYY